MDLLSVKSILDSIAGADLRGGLNSCSDIGGAEIEVQENFRAEQLVNVDLGREGIRSLYAVLDLDDVLGTDTEDDLLAVVAAVNKCLSLLCGCRILLQ